MATALASLRHASFSKDSIFGDVLLGVKIAELGKVACFSGPDGKPRYATITPAFVDALLSHAGSRSIPVHWTHDYKQGNGDALHAKVGKLKDIRKDSEGNPIADLHLAPGQYKETALWNAEHDPENMMLSPVFSYDPSDKDSTPLDFQAADLVECGAATTALFSAAQTQTQTQTKMTDEDKIEVAKMIADAIAAANKPADAPVVPDTAEMEATAGVTDADKKPEDEKAPALMAAFARCNRAIKRQLETAKGEAVVLAEAKFTAALGAGKFTLPAAPAAKDEVEEAIAAQISAGAKDRSTAIFRLAKDKPEIYNSARKAGKL
jgi:hypothetical protein